jgi:hypothetical protein
MATVVPPPHWREPLLGLPQLDLRPLTPSVKDCLERQTSRRDAADVAGIRLYVQRLGVTVLPHVAVPGGWLCTLIAVEGDPSVRHPVGVLCTVPDLDLETALVTDAWAPYSGLDGETYLALWLVRAAEAFPGRPLVLERSLVASADRDTLQVITHQRTFPDSPELPSTWLTSSTRLRASGIENGLDRLHDTGFLLEVEQHWDDAYQRRYAFAIPPTPRPA